MRGKNSLTQVSVYFLPGCTWRIFILTQRRSFSSTPVPGAPSHHAVPARPSTAFAAETLQIESAKYAHVDDVDTH